MSNDSSDDTRRWDAFIDWARRFYEWPDFDKEERDYKLVVADRLRDVRRALNNGDEQMWPELMHQAMQPPNNLLYWTVKDAFPKWCAKHPREASQVLLHLWDGTTAASVRDRVDRFKTEVDRDAIGGQGAIVASFLLMALDPTTYAMYRNDAYVRAYRLTGYPDRPKHGAGAIYQHALDFLDRLLVEARRRGLPLRDRLDAQGVVWCVTWYKVTDAPVSEWSEQERERLLAYREERGPDKVTQRDDNVSSGQGESDADAHRQSAPDSEIGSDGDGLGGMDEASTAGIAWMFQFNPQGYELGKHIREHGPFDHWPAVQHRTRMRVGQRVYFLQSGGTDHAALIALGRIVSPVYPAPEDSRDPYRVDVWYEARIEPPLDRRFIREDEVLAQYRPYAVGMFNTNFPLPPAVAARTAEVVEGRLQPYDIEGHVVKSELAERLDHISVVDARTRVTAEVVRRQGQPEFRQQLLAVYGCRCAVTGCDAVEALEAAHIAPYRGLHTNSVTNGLLLRADIHTLFDLGLLAIETETMTVLLAPSLAGTTYAPLEGQPLRLPANAVLCPDTAALDEHRRRSGL